MSWPASYRHAFRAFLEEVCDHAPILCRASSWGVDLSAIVVASPNGESEGSPYVWSDRGWNAQGTPVDDPLKSYRKRPLMSGGGPNATYVGRVVIELWEDGSSSDDQMIAMSTDAVNGSHAKLLDRIAAAVAATMQRGNPFNRP